MSDNNQKIPVDDGGFGGNAEIVGTGTGDPNLMNVVEGVADQKSLLAGNTPENVASPEQLKDKLPEDTSISKAPTEAPNVINMLEGIPFIGEPPPDHGDTILTGTEQTGSVTGDGTTPDHEDTIPTDTQKDGSVAAPGNNIYSQVGGLTIAKADEVTIASVINLKPEQDNILTGGWQSTPSIVPDVSNEQVMPPGGQVQIPKNNIMDGAGGLPAGQRAGQATRGAATTTQAEAEAERLRRQGYGRPNNSGIAAIAGLIGAGFGLLGKGLKLGAKGFTEPNDLEKAQKESLQYQQGEAARTLRESIATRQFETAAASFKYMSEQHDKVFSSIRAANAAVLALPEGKVFERLLNDKIKAKANAEADMAGVAVTSLRLRAARDGVFNEIHDLGKTSDIEINVLRKRMGHLALLPEVATHLGAAEHAAAMMEPSMAKGFKDFNNAMTNMPDGVERSEAAAKFSQFAENMQIKSTTEADDSLVSKPGADSALKRLESMSVQMQESMKEFAENIRSAIEKFFASITGRAPSP